MCQQALKPLLVFDMGTISGIERKYFKGNLIDNTFKENFIDNISLKKILLIISLKKILWIIPLKMHSIPHLGH